MKFDKETIIGLVLCLLLMLAWPSISQALGWGPAETGEPVAEKTIQQSTDTVKAAPAATAAAAVEKTAVPAAAKKKTADGILRNDQKHPFCQLQTQHRRPQHRHCRHRIIRVGNPRQHPH